MKKALTVLVTLIALAILGTGTFLVIRKFTTAHGNPVAEIEIQTVVDEFGKKLQTVSVLAPTDQAAQAIQQNYAAYVVPDLLAQWMAAPGNAPGKVTSSPWPDRIEISRVTMKSSAKYLVTGRVIELTSNEVEHGGIAAARQITLTVEWMDGKWLITNVVLGTYSNP
jgi:hypothetical protein